MDWQRSSECRRAHNSVQGNEVGVCYSRCNGCVCGRYGKRSIITVLPHSIDDSGYQRMYVAPTPPDATPVPHFRNLRQHKWILRVSLSSFGRERVDSRDGDQELLGSTGESNPRSVGSLVRRSKPHVLSFATDAAPVCSREMIVLHAGLHFAAQSMVLVHRSTPAFCRPFVYERFRQWTCRTTHAGALRV